MVHTAFAHPLPQPASPVYVVSEADRGYAVYSTDDPRAVFTVTGCPAAPHCTCPEFQNRTDPQFRCGHIDAVFGKRNGSPEEIDPIEAEERRAIQEEARPHVLPVLYPSDLILKRSVSPDGKIDSLSVEFSCSVHEHEFEATMNQAGTVIALQDAIVQSFLTNRQELRTSSNGNGRPPVNGNPAHAPGGYHDGEPTSNGQTNGNGHTIPATLVSIGGMNTRSGWRLYIAIEGGEKQFKLFGDKQKLADYLRDAGVSWNAQDIRPGLPLDIPCEVVTEPSKDGRYENVVRVRPSRTGGRAFR